MFKLIGILLTAAIAVVLILASQKPDIFRVERSIVINAPAAKIFPLVNDLREGEKWSPWNKLDPNMKKTFTDPSAGVGASTSWDGNKQVGAGSMTITESVPDTKVVSRLDFLKPFKGTNTAEFALQPQDGGTKVTWSMYGPQPFFGKIMSLFMNCEKMCGLQFEKGLADMKKTAES